MPQENIPWLGLRDPVSSSTHFAACVFGIFATALLWRLARNRGRNAQVALGVFGVSMVLLYGASATYHALLLPPERLRIFQMLDHSAIYVLIAGSYTPAFYFLLPDRPYRRLYLGGIWLLAVGGIACKWTIADVPYWLTVGLYIGMGWVGVLTVTEMLRAIGARGMAWVLWGGLSYTVGGLADLLHWPRVLPGLFGAHELFHLFAMGGTFCHFIFIVKHVLPFRRRAPKPHPAPAPRPVNPGLQPE
ncbi:MAG TPA: hemolysin III family protein [Gemmataceae bacterium]|nr:hemolysin III family protein [Gemmataceae bacterium]